MIFVYLALMAVVGFQFGRLSMSIEIERLQSAGAAWRDVARRHEQTIAQLRAQIAQKEVE